MNGALPSHVICVGIHKALELLQIPCFVCVQWNHEHWWEWFKFG